jgi:outer membrane lipoprotein-sorting protein
LFFLLLFSYNTVYALAINNLRVEFTRNFKRKDIEETIEGILYYRFPEKVLAYIYKPIKQWMSFENNEILIYYPEDSIAFKFISPYPVSFSFFETFLNVMKEDFGVCSRGYSLLNHEIKKDTLITYWKPPKEISEKIGELKLVFVDNTIISSELEKTTGEILLKTSYSEHFDYGEYHFPLEISSSLFTDTDTVLEKISFKNPAFNDSLPQEVAKFKIPEGIEVEEIRW